MRPGRRRAGGRPPRPDQRLSRRTFSSAGNHGRRNTAVRPSPAGEIILRRKILGERRKRASQRPTPM